jgi:membrane-bound acyltransferase YfiQ involved in biofilm formation
MVSIMKSLTELYPEREAAVSMSVLKAGVTRASSRASSRVIGSVIVLMVICTAHNRTEFNLNSAGKVLFTVEAKAGKGIDPHANPRF